MKIYYYILIMLLISACGNETNNTKQVQHDSDYITNLPMEELSEAEIEALHLTLEDEYKAEAIYQKVLNKFGDITPFRNIINAEKKHSSSLIEVYIKYGLDIPANEWTKKAPEFDSVKEACAAGVEAEIENVALYDGLIPNIDNQDLILVFTSLRDASQTKHLPAFERCA